MTKEIRKRESAEYVVGSNCEARVGASTNGKMRIEQRRGEPAANIAAGMEAAEDLAVKVIIQDRETKYYLSANGCWVATETDARDFFSLLPAYHFARNFTSRGFKVVLYCPEDNYQTVIIEGEGACGDDMAEPEAAKPSHHVNQGAARASIWERFNACMRMTRAELN